MSVTNNRKAFAAEIDIARNSSMNSFLQWLLENHSRIIVINKAEYLFNSNIWYKKFHKVTDEN